MTDNGVAEQDVLFPRTRADVMYHERRSGRLAIAHDADVQDAAAQIPGDDVAG
jgi:hypothetical protein